MEPERALQILAVEDDREFSEALRLLLKAKLAAEVTIAEDCASARNLLASSKFDLITLDYKLPDGNGLQLLEEITLLENHPPVVMVTGKGDEETAANSFHASAAGYVMKDDRLSVMLPAVVERALDQKYTAEALRVSEVRYRRLFEAAKDGILILDAESGEITDANPFLLNLLGYTANELLGKHLWEIGPLNDVLQSKELFAELQLKDYVRYEHLPLETKQGERRDVEIVSNVYSADHKRVIQCNIRDITARTRANGVRKVAEEKLRRANVELESFAGNVSHDMRTPLAAMSAANQTLLELLKGPPTEENSALIEEMIDLMQRSIARTDHLVEDLLQLAEVGQTPSQVERIEVRDVVGRVLEERASDLRERGARVEVKDDLGQVVADSTHVYQLFANLIGNAITHNDSDAPVVRIGYLGDDGGGHRYRVCDNGSGIPEENIGKVFAPFFKTKASGTGIGLAIVHKIVKLYGGDIEVYNDSGACLEFTLRDFEA